MRALAGRSSPQARFSRTVIFVAVVLDDLNTRFIACTLLHFPYIEEASDFLLTLLLERLCTFALRRTLLHVGVHSFFDIYLLIHQAPKFFLLRRPPGSSALCRIPFGQSMSAVHFLHPVVSEHEVSQYSARPILLPIDEP